MTDERRRVDDPRLVDIQGSVHEINGVVHNLERRMDRHDQRITEAERKVIENAADQKALERVMNSEITRLGDKLDGLGETMGSHLDDSAKRDNTLMRLVVSILLSVMGALAWFMFTAVAAGKA